MSRHLLWTLLAAPLLVSPLAVGATGTGAIPLTEKGVVETTIARNPTVKAAVTDVQQTAELVRSEEGRYRPKLFGEVAASTLRSPSLDIAGGVNSQLNQGITGAAELSQTFSWGTTVALRLENRNTWLEGPLFSGATDTFVLGPGHLLGARLSVTQPLLRGAWNQVGLAPLRTARLNQEQSVRARDETASAALSNALQAYWDLWFAQKAVLIERDARDLSILQRDELAQKVNLGSVAEVELLPFETRIAELDQAVLDAEVVVTTRTVDLRRALGLEQPIAFDVSAATPPEIFEVEPEAVVAAATDSSYTVAQSRIAVEQNENVAITAGEDTRPRLDVAAWVQAEGLGNDAVAPIFDQFGDLSHVSANVGLIFELPLSGQQHAGQVASARMAVKAAKQRLDAAVLEVTTEAERELASLEQAREKIALAERTADVSSRSVIAQNRRLEIGTATPIEVREAEDSLRRARLSVERQRIEAVKAQIRLRHLTGDLLLRWGVELPANDS